MVMTAGAAADGANDDFDDEDEAQGLAGDVEAGRSLVGAACSSPNNSWCCTYLPSNSEGAGSVHGAAEACKVQFGAWEAAAKHVVAYSCAVFSPVRLSPAVLYAVPCCVLCAVLPQVVRGYEAVLTDFGSARAVPMHIGSRAAALTVQEDAEVGTGSCNAYLVHAWLFCGDAMLIWIDEVCDHLQYMATMQFKTVRACWLESCNSRESRKSHGMRSVS
jgi:hypothetical protein